MISARAAGSASAARRDRDGRGIRLASAAHRDALVCASSTTSTPRASRARRSCRRSARRAAPAPAGGREHSTTFGSAPRPTTCSPGRYAMCARPANGSRWCSQTERNGCRAAAPRPRAACRARARETLMVCARGGGILADAGEELRVRVGDALRGRFSPGDRDPPRSRRGSRTAAATRSRSTATSRA
jgi:hypothetical protein